MPRTSFKKVASAPSTETSPVVEETSSAIVPVTQTESSVIPFTPTAEFTGAWDRSDVKYPRVNLVQKSSDIKLHAFGLGSFVLNRELKLSDGKSPLQLTVVASDKDFQQKLPWGSKDEATVCRTPEEVRKAGGTLTYKGAKPGTYYGPRAHQTLLIRAPEFISTDDLAFFPYEFTDESGEISRWTVAKMTVSSSGFTSMAKEIATLCTFNKVMRRGSIAGQLQLTSKLVAGDTEEWFVPVVKFDRENSKQLLEFFESLR